MDFDTSKNFGDNLEAFIVRMEAVDVQMGKILRDNVDTLKVANDDTSRKRARIDFNKNIIIALDRLQEECIGA